MSSRALAYASTSTPRSDTAPALDAAKSARHSIAFHLGALIGLQLLLLVGLGTWARIGVRELALPGSLVLALTLLLGAAIHRRIARPIGALACAVREAAEGNVRVQLPADGPSELAELAERLNALLAARSEVESELINAYEAERQAGDRMRELDNLKGTFQRAISHAIRSPLSLVVGFTGLLATPDRNRSPEQSLEVARRLAGQAKQLERLVRDLLDLERLTRGAMEPRCRPADLRAIAVGAVQRAGCEDYVTVDIKRGMRGIVDPGLAGRVIENLVLNAWKHTPPGTPIWMRARHEGSDLLLMVEDAGPGVPDELKSVIFEPFRLGDPEAGAPGAGVGLALVSHFARLHGGRAWVQDVPGGGASFRVSLAAVNARRPEPIAS